jgi:hypothetical protein
MITPRPLAHWNGLWMLMICTVAFGGHGSTPATNHRACTGNRAGGTTVTEALIRTFPSSIGSSSAPPPEGRRGVCVLGVFQVSVWPWGLPASGAKRAGGRLRKGLEGCEAAAAKRRPGPAKPGFALFCRRQTSAEMRPIPFPPYSSSFNLPQSLMVLSSDPEASSLPS